MSIESAELSQQQRETARALWDALTKAPTLQALDEAREKFSVAPHDIRMAVLQEYTLQIQQGKNPINMQNPFK